MQPEAADAPRMTVSRAPLLNNVGGTERGIRDICVASACAHPRHTDDTHAFPQTTFFVVSKPMVIASSARHLLVTKKKTYPLFRSPPI